MQAKTSQQHVRLTSMLPDPPEQTFLSYFTLTGKKEYELFLLQANTIS